jgi:16S rRNA (guanine1207-N2)-methyltransferase
LTDHYFSPHQSAPHRPGQVRVILPDLYLGLATDAGVFSPGRLDPGTRLLLEESPAPPASGDLLDLGCGYGPIACVLAARSPGATVWAVDVNERALELCARNARAAGRQNVHCVTPGDASVPARFAAIWSNPPVRIGKDALHALLGQWLARLGPGGSASHAASGGSASHAASGGSASHAASGGSASHAASGGSASHAASGGSASHAASGGSAYLVVGRNLGADSLHRWLTGQGWPVTRLAARSGYRLLQVDYRAERAEVTRP